MADKPTTEPDTRPFSERWVTDKDFVGFENVANLRSSRCASVPRDPGVYIVISDRTTPPEWLKLSTGGHFKGRDPTVAIEILEDRFIAGTPVLYIGKADQLQRRISQYVRFGIGARIGHSGGRYIWQLKDSSELMIAWRQDDEPRLLENRLIVEFESEFESMPFANLQR